MSVADLVTALMGAAQVDDGVSLVRREDGGLELFAGDRYVGGFSTVWSEKGWARRNATRPS